MLSIVIPIYNEQDNLKILFKRLYKSLDKLNTKFEVIFVNDGSKDDSLKLLKAQYSLRPLETRIINFDGNFGQHMAIIGAFENMRGKHAITLDGDLQNPPEEIGKVLKKLNAGYDVVGTYRARRKDSFFRKTASKAINTIRRSITNIQMRDQGCMLRGYSKRIVDLLVKTDELNTFIPATAQTYSVNPIEIEVAHEKRAFGQSKYSLYSLIRLNFDLMTGYSLIPLQIFTLIGLIVSLGSFSLVGILMYRRIFLGSEAEGLFTLFAMVFFLLGIVITGLGIVGEYIGRIYLQVRGRPKFIIAEIIEKKQKLKPQKEK